MEPQHHNSVITVGDGRGFVVKGPSNRRFVVTAAHCLPFFPECYHRTLYGLENISGSSLTTSGKAIRLGGMSFC